MLWQKLGFCNKTDDASCINFFKQVHEGKVRNIYSVFWPMLYVSEENASQSLDIYTKGFDFSCIQSQFW